MTRVATGFSVALMALTGCQDVIDLDPLDTRVPVEPRVRPKPITGGTLTVTTASIAVAADPDRDLVHIVDVPARKVTHTIALEAGDDPGRVVQGSDNLAHVVLRGFGGVATIDVVSGEVIARHTVCSEPRGIAFDESSTSLHVACADGTLAEISESNGEEIERQVMEPDLRDVVMLGGARYLSRFREASLLQPNGRTQKLDGDLRFAPGVAWRTFANNDRIMMLHQMSDTAPVPIDPAAASEDFNGGGGGLPYGGGGNLCEPGISSVALSIIDGDATHTVMVPGGALTVDAASDNEGNIALAMPGAAEGSATVVFMDEHDGCFTTEVPVDGQVTAVATAPDGAFVMFSREPARLFVQEIAVFGDVDTVALQGEAVYDSGHEIFHRATESGLSCASCHPEGTDDGHVWQFLELGPRRTQPVDIGLEGTAPFHWDGDMGDMDVLMGEVLAHRMGGKRQSDERADSFSRWLFEQQRPPARGHNDDAALVTEGESLFAGYDCVSCHTGDKLGGVRTTPIAGKDLQVPSLRRVALRPPFMHDGRSETLDDAVRDMIATTTSIVAPPDHDIDAVSAYLRTL